MAENIPDNKPKTVRRPRLKLPFDNRKEDAGVWAYDHRIGLCVTIIAYLVLMIAFVSSKIVVGRRPHTQGMFIDLQTLAELEKERDRLEQQVRERQQQDPIDWKSVQNQVSNENALNEKLRDDRGTNAAALNDAAAEAERRMQANREAYEQGLAEERAIRERNGAGKDEERQDRKVKGRVTVSFSLTDPGLPLRGRGRRGRRNHGQPCGRGGQRPCAERRRRVHARIGPACGAGFALQYRPVGPCAPAGDDYVHFYPAISSFCPAGVGYSAEIVNFAEVNSGSDRAVSPAAIRCGLYAACAVSVSCRRPNRACVKLSSYCWAFSAVCSFAGAAAGRLRMTQGMSPLRFRSIAPPTPCGFASANTTPT